MGYIKNLSYFWQLSVTLIHAVLHVNVLEVIKWSHYLSLC